MGGIGRVFRIANDYAPLIDRVSDGHVPAQSFEELQAIPGAV